MSTNYPLYDILKSESKNYESKKSDKDIVKYIENYSSVKCDVYCIIKLYSLDNKEPALAIPYKGTEVQQKDEKYSDITFDLKNFPNELKLLLEIFFTRHVKMV
jgi:hypothetical protein